MPWRTCMAFGGTGCALAFAWRGDWVPAGLAAGGVLLAVAFWVYGELAATAALMRERPDHHEHCDQATTAETAPASDGRFIAAAIGELADWADDELAGGMPPMYVAQQVTVALHHLSRAVRDGGVSGEALSASLSVGVSLKARVLQPRL